MIAEKKNKLFFSGKTNNSPMAAGNTAAQVQVIILVLGRKIIG